MIDLSQCHWVVDEHNRLFIASAPSLRAPFRFDCFTHSHQLSRRLTVEEAEAIGQAAIDCGVRPLTFLNSDEGICFVQSLVVGTAHVA